MKKRLIKPEWWLAPLTFAVILFLASAEGRFVKIGILEYIILLCTSTLALSYFLFTRLDRRNITQINYNISFLILFLFPALFLSFKFQNLLIFISLSLTILLCVFAFTQKYTYLPFIVFLIIVGINLHHLTPNAGDHNHLEYIEKIAAGEPYENIAYSSLVGYLLPVYYTLPKYAALITGLPVGRAAQALNFLYAILTATFLLLILRTKYLKTVSDRTKIIGIFIMFSAASMSRLFSYLRAEPLQFLFIIISIYFLLKGHEKAKNYYITLSVLAATAATITRFTAFFYWTALISYYGTNALITKKEIVKTAAIIFAAAVLLFATFAFFQMSPLYHPAQNMTGYSSEHFKLSYVFGWRFDPFGASIVTNYLQTFVNDWWGDSKRYYHTYDNRAMWIIHLLLSYAATMLIIACIAIYCFKNIREKTRLATKIKQPDAFFALHLLILMPATAYLIYKYANPDMDMLKAIYFIQAFPSIMFLFIKSLDKRKLNDNILLITSMFFFTLSIYTHLL